MTRRRRNAIKTLLLAVTAIAVAGLPALSLTAFLYLCAIVTAAVGILALGVVFNLVQFYVEFRAFEQRTDELARRTFGWKP